MAAKGLGKALAVTLDGAWGVTEADGRRVS